MRKKMSEDERFMKEAIRQAKKAYALEETPIGCVLVHEGKIIARGYNKRNKKKNTLAHAEIIVINKASRVLGDWRLEECTMYVTLEPCPMCAWSDRAGKNPQSGDRKHESEGGMCRFRPESAGYAGV